MSFIHPLIPAKAGTQDRSEQWAPQRITAARVRVLASARRHLSWVPAFAGMSGMVCALALPGAASAAHKKAPAAPPEDSAAASAQLADIDKRITRLEDANQVEIVQRTYGYFVDKAQWTQLSKLFTDDATLEIGGRGVFVGRDHVLEYMQKAFGPDGIKEGSIINHMQFQPIADIDPDGVHAKQRMRAFVMSNGGWGLPLYENEYRKENGVWKISKLHGPFTMYTSWDGWAKAATPNTRPESFGEPPDLPPTVVYLTYPNYYIVPFHYPNPVTGKPWNPGTQQAGAYASPSQVSLDNPRQ